MNTHENIFFSICIPAYENIDALKRCLSSVLSQKNINFEIVISDDSKSTKIEDYIKSLNAENIRYYHNSPSLGVPCNWNILFSYIKGNWCTLLHQDDWYAHENVLKDLSTHIDNNNSDVVISGRTLFQGSKILGKYVPKKNSGEKFIKHFSQRNIVVNQIGHPSVIFFHKKHADILYRESLTYFVDTDYFYRLFKTAQKVSVYDKPDVCIMRGEEGQLSKLCVESPLTLFEELYTVHKSNGSSELAKGVSAARLFITHIKHWKISQIKPILQHMKHHTSASGCIAALTSAPIFIYHMAYRLLLRTLFNKRWG